LDSPLFAASRYGNASQKKSGYEVGGAGLSFIHHRTYLSDTRQFEK
jgi:hypothetical protein